MSATPNSYITIVVETTDATTTLNPSIAPVPPTVFTAKKGLQQLAKYLDALAGGFAASKTVVSVQTTTGWTAASGTVAIVVASPPSDGDTVVINGITFVYKTTPATNPVNPLEVAIGADGSASITNLKTAIEANAWLNALVTGAITGTTTKTLTLTAVMKGSWGNEMTITRVGAAITVGTFASGTNGTTAPSLGGLSVYDLGG